jgi:hypothetical protein
MLWYMGIENDASKNLIRTIYLLINKMVLLVFDASKNLIRTIYLLINKMVLLVFPRKFCRDNHRCCGNES